jgi:hypothetical protein
MSDQWVKLTKKYGQASNLRFADQAIEQAEAKMKQLRDLSNANSLPENRNQLYSQLSQMAFDLQSQILPTIQSDQSEQGKILAKQALDTYNKLMWWIKSINQPRKPVATPNAATTNRLVKKYS